MANDCGAVWVVAEQRDCRIRTVSLQLLAKARQLAQQLDSRAEAVLFGDQLEGRIQPLFGAGAERVFLGNDPQLAEYQPELYLEALVQLAQAHCPEIVLIGSTAMGRELAPLLAARLRTGLTAHCIDLELNADNILDQHIPAYGGLMTIVCPQKRPQMATVAKGVFPLPPPDTQTTGEVIPVALPENLPGRIRTIEVVQQPSDEISLDDAPIVVAGGAGAGDDEGWRQIADLAANLNAALGCTRPAVDEGWAPLDTMIGQSGRMVSPQFYIGVGLSGEQQHMVGITGAQVMVAINNDEAAPIFEQVDIGVVEDCRDFVPQLIKAIAKRREELVTCETPVDDSAV